MITAPILAVAAILEGFFGLSEQKATTKRRLAVLLLV
jgi:hypothetical protein